MNSALKLRNCSGGYTLIEMLAVLAIIGILTILCVGLTDISPKNFGKDISDVANILNQSRAYAIANNTYVFVGIEEVDGNQSPGTNPPIAGNGRIAMAAVASTNGTRLYDSNSWMTTNPTNLTPIIPLSTFNNIHLSDFSSLTATSGGMMRPAVSSTYSLASNSFPLTTYQFSWPLSGNTQYTFNKVIQFDPTGQASALPNVYTIAGSGIDTMLEMGFLPSHGNIVNATPTNISIGDQAAIQIDGTTGTIQLYRP